MTNENKNIEKPIWMHFLRGVAIAVSALILKSIVSFAILFTYSSKNNLIGDLPNFLLYIVTFIASILIYNSIFSIFQMFDKTGYLQISSVSSLDEFGLKKLFTHKPFLVECISVSFIISLAAALGASPEISGMFYFAEGRAPFRTGIIPFFATLFIVFLIFVFQKSESLRYWKYLEKRGQQKEIENKRRIIIRALIISISYPLVLPYLPLAVAYAFSLITVAIAVLTAPVFFGIIVVFIILLFAIKIFSSLYIRKKMLKSLYTITREFRIELKEMKNPYASLFSKKKNCTFQLNIKKELFYCVIIGSVFRSVPICFTSDFEGYYRYRIGTKNHNITMQKHFDYKTPEDRKKIVILNPTPKQAILCDMEKERRLFNAEKMWNSVVYEADAFIGAIDRECLGKYSTVIEDDDIKLPGRFGLL